MDWEKGEELNNKFSGTTIPLYNYGGTAAINIAYSYRCNNLHKLQENINDKFKNGQHDIKIDSINDEKESFDIYFQNSMKQKRFLEIKRNIRRKDVIEPGKKWGYYCLAMF